MAISICSILFRIYAVAEWDNASGREIPGRLKCFSNVPITLIVLLTYFWNRLNIVRITGQWCHQLLLRDKMADLQSANSYNALLQLILTILELNLAEINLLPCYRVEYKIHIFAPRISWYTRERLKDTGKAEYITFAPGLFGRLETTKFQYRHRRIKKCVRTQDLRYLLMNLTIPPASVFTAELSRIFGACKYVQARKGVEVRLN